MPPEESTRTPGNSQRMAIAGVRVELESSLESRKLRLPSHYHPFETKQRGCDLRIHVNPLNEPDRGSNSYLFRCSTFAVRSSEGRIIIESYHPAYARLVARAEAGGDFLEYDLRFDEAFFDWLSLQHAIAREEVLVLSYPVDQVMFLPVLARHQAFLMHACAAVLNGKALVFAGHSGDGKTTLSRILAEEGLELLSDERVAIRKWGDSFVAYGTPWPGEGQVVSSGAYPLGGLFLLRKAGKNRLRQRGSSTWVAEALSRCIVPYYLPAETSQIVELLAGAADAVPTGVFEFSPFPGIVPVLSRTA